jgi:glycosyltransferase involved in cell wall biosynthesis
MRSDFTLSVIVPVYNERLTIRRLVERVRAVPIRKEIIIVDDASTDGTTEVIRDIAAAGETDPDNRIRALFHPQNAGKGAAIRTAIPAVSGDIALIQDADLEYDPDEYPNLIEPILAGHADVVFGSRFLGGPHRVLFFRHSMGNKLLTFLSNLCTDLNLTDMETCYKVFRSDVLKRLQLVSNRFGIEPEITAKVARLGVRVYEVPVSYHGREYWEGKKIGWKDGVAAIWTIARAALSDDGEPFGGEPGMRRVRHTRRYTDWVWSRISPFVGDRILEVGDGSYTRYLRHHSLVVASGDDGAYLGQLRTRFAQHDNIRVQTIDWTQPALDPLRAERFDTVLCLNGLEYAAQDDDLLAHFADLLGPGGRHARPLRRDGSRHRPPAPLRARRARRQAAPPRLRRRAGALRQPARRAQLVPQLARVAPRRHPGPAGPPRRPFCSLAPPRGALQPGTGSDLARRRPEGVAAASRRLR